MYESFYKLKDKPFQLSPDPRFYYASRGHKRVLAYLRYGINQGEGFIIVTGEVGTGKTTLIGTLFEDLAENPNIVARQLVTTHLDADHLLQMIAASFGLEYEGLTKSELLKNLEVFLRQQDKEGRRVLLIVDEIQNLSVHSLEELRMLSNYQVGNKPLLQSFLLGQAEFRETLASEHLEQLRQRVIGSYHLGAMALDDTRGYIEHRLRRAGWKEDPKFSPDAFVAIYGHTGGIPRRINTLCERIMLTSYLEESHEITEATINRVVKEIERESSVPDSESPTKKKVVSAPRPYLDDDQPTVLSSVSKAETSALEDRLEQLERRLNATEDAMISLKNLLRDFASS